MKTMSSLIIIDDYITSKWLRCSW